MRVMKRQTKKSGINYKEAIARCSKLLNEKKLNESSFEDIIAPAMQLLDVIHNTGSQLPDIPYNELIGPDTNLELDVSENDLNPETGTLTENTKKVRALKEAAGQAGAVKAYIAQGGAPDYEEFCTWANGNGYADVASSLKPGMFNYKYKELSGKAARQVPVEPAQPVNAGPVEISDNLANLIDICNAGEEFVESAVDTVTTKYNTIRMKLKRVITGKALKNYYLLMGDAGIGKSYIVRENLDKLGYEDVPQITGSVGASQSAVAIFLWQNRNKELVVLDDCDSMITNAASTDVKNMLKGAMDPDRHHVHISPTICDRANSMLQAMSESAKNKNDRLFESEEDLDLEPGENYEGGDLDTDNTIPMDWDFNARIIFISNLNENEVNPAILSRCDYYELHLTQEEYMVRLGMIIDRIDCGQGKVFEAEDVKEAKALLMTSLAAVIEAGNKGVSMFGKRITLKKGGLEFRLVKDAVETFLMMAEDRAEDLGEPMSEAKKAVIPAWVRTCLIPRVSA